MRARLRPWRRTHLGTEVDRATYRALHTASLASPALRGGLTRASAERGLRHLRTLLGTPAAALTDTSDVLHWDGIASHHQAQVPALIGPVVENGRTRVVSRADLPCDDPGCSVRQLVISPLVVSETLVGTLVAGAPQATGSLVRAADEVAVWVSGQLELAQLDASRTELMEAEVRALRAGPRPAARVRRLHALLLPPARRVHDAGRGAPVGRAVPAARAGPVRRPPAGDAADRP